MIKISEWADDLAEGKVTYRGHDVEFMFRPGAYTNRLVADSSLVEVIAGCVAEWNIECPLDPVKMAELPEGVILAVFRRVRDLALQADLGEVAAGITDWVGAGHLGFGDPPDWYLELRNLEAAADRFRCPVWDLIDPAVRRLNRPQIVMMVRAAEAAEQRGRIFRRRHEGKG